MTKLAQQNINGFLYNLGSCTNQEVLSKKVTYSTLIMGNLPLRNIALILSLFCLLPVQAGSPQFYFRHLDIVDGMSDNQVRGFILLPDGRMGVRTASILNIYNGATFDHIYHDRSREYNWDYRGLPREYCDAENRLWMKNYDHLLLLDLNTNRINYDIERELRSMGMTEKIKNLFIDDAKNIWTIAENGTVSYFDEGRGERVVVTEGSSDFVREYGTPREMAQYKNFNWIIYSSGLLRCWDYSSREFVSQDTHFLSVINDQIDRLYIHTTSSGNLCLMHNHGVSLFDRSNGSWRELATISGRSNFFTCMDIDNNGDIWLGTSLSGLRCIEHDTFQTTVIPGMRLDSGDTLVNDIHAVYADDNNGIWVGTLFQGICYYQPGRRKFQMVQTKQNAGALTSENVRCIFDEGDGNVLVGTANGLFRFHSGEQKLERVYDELSHELCMDIYRDSKGKLWISTFLGGIYCIEKGTVRNYKWLKETGGQDPVYNTARCFHQDREGRYWVGIGLSEGVGEFFPETGKIKLLRDKHPKISSHKINYEIFPTGDHSFGVIGEHGIYFYDTHTDSLYLPSLDDPHNPKYGGENIRYYCIFNDSRSLEWQATELGINVWDPEEGKLYILTMEDGLPSSTMSAILEDRSGLIWASSANGISKIQVVKEESGYRFSIVNFGVPDGLQSGKFYSQSGLLTDDGTIYFGGVHGFNYFNPEKIQYNHSARKPLFTSFSLFNTLIKEDSVYRKRVILDMPLNRIEEISLNHNENFISLEFTGLNYVNPAQTYFRYKLENFDQEWTEIVTNGAGKVTYTGLRPGIYKLIVYSANNDKLWGDIPAELTIRIGSPFWATGYAYAFYLLLFVLLLIVFQHFMESRNRKKLEVQQEISRREQKEEMDQMKFRFFTNISHEFRTPLTLITTPLDILIKEETNERRKNRLLSVRRNANDLLTLVNQLLDFRKLEMTGDKAVLRRHNIVEFVESICYLFKDTAAARNIGFEIEKEIDTTIIYFDKNKIQKVINNLLSNALKFTPDGGKIDVRIGKETAEKRTYIRIDINDTGCGISDEDQERIFDRFYQSRVEESFQTGSSGIGLHLVKEYLDMHEGRIGVRSQEGAGSSFSIYIPVDLKGEAERDETEREKETIATDPASSVGKRTILVVEDNTEFRHFMVEQLSMEFNVLEAEDGQVGQEAAISYSPDLIVSDLMMPKMDGLALCRSLKSNIRTSHIPFILLTARTSDEAKMDGYDAGADSYISKPFNFELLLIRIKKLIELQEKRHELFHKAIEVTPESITGNSLDEEFIQKVLRCIEKNIDNTEYSVEELSSDVGLHRSHLYRKIQSITGQTPINFMRLIRLKKAVQLLINSQYNISEIADMVGFNTIKYFNKYFKEEFGMTPSQYRNTQYEYKKQK